MGEKTGYKVRVVENAGTQLKRVFPSTNPWGTRDCSRPDCVMCNQGDEAIQDCRRRNVLYENKCTLCQVGEGENKDNGRGVYIGESARSLYERSKEHEADKEARNEDSHQIKHWVVDHPEKVVVVEAGQ